MMVLGRFFVTLALAAWLTLISLPGIVVTRFGWRLSSHESRFRSGCIQIRAHCPYDYPINLGTRRNPSSNRSRLPIARSGTAGRNCSDLSRLGYYDSRANRSRQETKSKRPQRSPQNRPLVVGSKAAINRVCPGRVLFYPVASCEGKSHPTTCTLPQCSTTVFNDLASRSNAQTTTTSILPLRRSFIMMVRAGLSFLAPLWPLSRYTT